MKGLKQFQIKTLCVSVSRDLWSSMVAESLGSLHGQTLLCQTRDGTTRWAGFPARCALGERKDC